MWFNLAAAQGNSDAVQGRAMAEKQMTPADVTKAQRLAREWPEKHEK